MSKWRLKKVNGKYEVRELDGTPITSTQLRSYTNDDLGLLRDAFLVCQEMNSTNSRASDTLFPLDKEAWG